MRCVELYRDAASTWRPNRKVGSVCPRQATDELGEIVEMLAALGLRLDGLGAKAESLRRYGQYLASADGVAWSLRGRLQWPGRARP
jgi:hypothetical protein